MTIKELSCGDTFNGASNFGWREGGNRLKKEMNMIFICSNFYEGDFVVLCNRPTDIFQRFFYGFDKDFLPVFHRTNKMVEEERNIVGLPFMVAHGDMLPEE